MIAFAYFGGKYRMIEDLLPMLPECDHYCEPFAGSLSILLNRRPSSIETANDLNSDLTNFFRVLRTNGKKLVKSLQCTPYSREEFELAWIPCEDRTERARRFFIRVTMDIAKAGRKTDKSWSANTKFCPGEHSYAPANFIKKVKGLPEIVDRLRMVQIENRPALKVVKKFDHPNTLFYCDPPYIHETRSSKKDYLHEMSFDDHVELAEVLNACKAMVALSGYDHPAMDDLYSAPKWYKHKFKSKQVPMSQGNGLVRQEVLWTNYDPAEKLGQLKLFT